MKPPPPPSTAPSGIGGSARNRKMPATVSVPAAPATRLPRRGAGLRTRRASRARTHRLGDVGPRRPDGHGRKPRQDKGHLDGLLHVGCAVGDAEGEAHREHQ